MTTTARPGQYQLFADLPADDYSALKADIAKRGVLVPVELDEHGNVLDGHHRVRACHELGLTDYPRIVRPGMSESEKRAHVRALNLLRRHLTSEQKRAVIADQIRETPERSDLSIAKEFHVDNETVTRTRGRLERSGDVAQNATRTDAKGRKQPAKKPRSLKPSTPGILATTPAEERKAVSIAPAAGPEGVVAVAAAARDVRREHREQAREERESAEQEAEALDARILTVIDRDGKIAQARLKTTYATVIADIYHTLLPLQPDALAQTFDDGDWDQVERARADIAAWFTALQAARVQGLRVVGGNRS